MVYTLLFKFNNSLGGTFGGSCQIHGELPLAASESENLPQLTDGREDGSGLKSPIIKNPAYSHQYCPPEVHRSCFCVRFIAEHTKLQEDSTKVIYIYINLRVIVIFTLSKSYYRSKRTGSTWQWSSTDCFCGFSHWP